MHNKKTHFCKISFENDIGFIEMNAQEFQKNRAQYPNSHTQIFKDENLIEVIKTMPYRELILITEDLKDLSEKGLQLLKNLYKSIHWNNPVSATQQLIGAGEVIQLLCKPLYNEYMEAVCVLGKMIDKKSNTPQRITVKEMLDREN